MSALEQSFRDICEKHDLRAIGITIHPAHNDAFTVYVHANPGLCAGESRETLADALNASLALMAAKRGLLAGALADEPLPVEG